MGGWVVGGGKIKNKDQLSLAEARVEAELGNNILQICVTHNHRIQTHRILQVRSKYSPYHLGKRHSLA